MTQRAKKQENMSHDKESINRNRSRVDTGDKDFTIAFINTLRLLRKVEERISIIQTDMEDKGKGTKLDPQGWKLGQM